jgi:hypothetical protein
MPRLQGASILGWGMRKRITTNLHDSGETNSLDVIGCLRRPDRMVRHSASAADEPGRYERPD